ncbi:MULTISPECIES: hypothetical protein [Paenibacillus]|uniref:hypothetical protein n=1 Tax=Paenibacillus TaxID=44249 RepID=UPI0022B8C538|nr:hypothetical protein [Paenibacillus caseinilyticus]MCZ8521176.1 hypothetical protein [Paenibacillus caseinilyticus]
MEQEKIVKAEDIIAFLEIDPKAFTAWCERNLPQSSACGPQTYRELKELVS